MLVTRFSVAFVAPIVALASASANPAFEFPASVPLAKRQRDGPAFQCHSDCGNAILKVRASDVCDDEEWQSLLDNCLDCALKYDIWQYYGGELKPAAEECGIDATPKPAGGSSDVKTEGGSEDEPTDSASQVPSSTESASQVPSSSAESAHQVPSSSAESAHQVPSSTEKAKDSPQTEHSDAIPSSSVTTIVVPTGKATTADVTASAEAEPTPADGHDEHASSDVIPPTPTPSHVVGGAGALEASKLVAVLGAGFAMFAALN
ncbi:hypothetical protein LIA77_02227 [Sarocladium implicatum]|nr:hypothetical protein LIA77_02227 [Sarocladium implicatum]